MNFLLYFVVFQKEREFTQSVQEKSVNSLKNKKVV